MNNQELIELAKMAQANFHARRTIEWQLLLAYWGGLGLVVAVILANKSVMSVNGLLAIRCAMIALLFIVFFFCIIPMEGANATDKKLFHYYQHRIEGLDSGLTRPNDKDVAPIDRRWTLGLTLFSLFITLTALILISGVTP